MKKKYNSYFYVVKNYRVQLILQHHQSNFKQILFEMKVKSNNLK